MSNLQPNPYSADPTDTEVPQRRERKHSMVVCAGVLVLLAEAARELFRVISEQM